MDNVVLKDWCYFGNSFYKNEVLIFLYKRRINGRNILVFYRSWEICRSPDKRRRAYERNRSVNGICKEKTVAF